jgi:tetratricopeptide (TPR) repeat protein
LAAILFALNPIHVESVIWIKNRSDLFAFGFVMLAIWLFSKATSLGGPNSFGVVPQSAVEGKDSSKRQFSLYLAAALICFLAAALAKETAIVLPFVLTVIALGESPRARSLVLTLPFWLLAVLLVAARLAFARGGVVSPETALPVSGAVPKTYGAYAWLLFFPLGLNADRPLAGNATWPLGLALLCLFAIAPAYASRFTFHASRLTPHTSRITHRGWPLTLGLLWMLLTLLPVSNLVPLMSRPLAEQRLYLPSLGVCVILAALAHGRRKAHCLVLGLAVILAIGALHRNAVWRSNRHVWADAFRRSPANNRALCNLCNAYREERRLGLAERLLRRIVATDAAYPPARYRLAQTLHEKGDLDAAQRLYEDILNENGSFWEAWHELANVHRARGDLAGAAQTYERLLSLNADDAVGHCGLGHVYAERKDYERAKLAYLRAIKLNPEYIQARSTLADVLEALGDLDGALAQRNAVLYIDPTRPAARVSRGILLAKKGAMDDAIADFRYALRVEPWNRQAHYNLGLALEKSGQMAEAIEHYHQALGFSPDQDARLHCAMGDILRRANRATEAMAEYELALRSDPTCQRALHNLATLQLARDELDAAVRNYRAAVALDSGSAPAHFGLGVAYRKQGMLREARSEMEAALRLDPSLAPARQQLTELDGR